MERHERHSCGLPRSVCSDPEAAIYPEREVCYATMEREAANARYERLHKDRQWHDGTFSRWVKEPSKDYPYRFDMGVTIGVSETNLRPDDPFLNSESAAWPLPVVADGRDADLDDPGEGGGGETGHGADQ